MVFTNLFDSVLYDGSNGFKIARLDIPESCIAVEDKSRVYKLSFYSLSASKLKKAEYDTDGKNVTFYRFNGLIDYTGLVLPDDPKAPITRTNGRKIEKVDAIFTRDRRIYVGSHFNGSYLEETIKKVNGIFSLNKWQLLFESEVPKVSHVPKEHLSRKQTTLSSKVDDVPKVNT